MMRAPKPALKRYQKTYSSEVSCFPRGVRFAPEPSTWGDASRFVGPFTERLNRLNALGWLRKISGLVSLSDKVIPCTHIPLQTTLQRVARFPYPAAFAF
jgi:hypothetical protein